jgi:hypothetical protein
MSRAVRLRAVLLLGAISTFLLAGWYPYEVRSPLRDNGAERLNDGTLRFGAPGIARTETPPEWLEEATLSHRLAVLLRVRSLDLSQRGPVRIFTVSEDPWHRNITLGQDGDNPVVRLRTPGTDANGQPERVISKSLVTFGGLKSPWRSCQVGSASKLRVESGWTTTWMIIPSNISMPAIALRSGTN